MNTPGNNMHDGNDQRAQTTRRTFLKHTVYAAAGGTLAAKLPWTRAVHAAGSDTIRLGLVGCGGRGTGAAAQATIRRIHEGAVGDLIALHAACYGNGVWVRPRKPEMTEMEYQMRNWYYFTWL